MSIENILEKLFDFFKERGFLPVEAAGLLYRRKGYPFNPSAGHHIADSILIDKDPANPIQFSLSERCMREADTNKIGISNRHLTVFEMIEFSEVGDSHKLNYKKHVETIYEILVKILGLDKSRILITALDNIKIDNLEISVDDNKKTYNEWSKLLGQNKIVLTQGRRNFFITREFGSPGGIGYEIYYKLNNGQFIEIASQVNYKYVFWNNNDIRHARNENLACGFGLERLMMVFENKEKIHDISSIKPLKEIILQRGSENEKNLYDENCAIIADHIRTISFIVYDSQNKDMDLTQQKILRKIIKNLHSEIIYLGLDEKICGQILDVFIMLNQSRYPNFLKLKDKILSCIREGFKNV